MPKLNYILSQGQKKQIVFDYLGGMTLGKIATRYGVTLSAIQGILKRRGINRRPAAHLTSRHYVLNENFFAQPLASEAQAYLLGFFSADAGIYNGKVYVNLAERDKDHLVKILSLLNSNLPLHRKRIGYYGIQITSKKMVADLAALGIGPRKSFTCPAWDGPAHLLPHYWRGVLDGDGCWCFSNHRWALSLLGSPPMIEAFATYITRISDRRPSIRVHSQTPGIRITEVHGLNRLQAIARHLYEGASVWLDRKKDLVDRLLVYQQRKKQLKGKINAQELLALYKAHGDWRAVARALGFSYSTLRVLRHSFDLPFFQERDWSSLTGDDLRQLHKTHGTWDKVAEVLDIWSSQLTSLKQRLLR